MRSKLIILLLLITGNPLWSFQYSEEADTTATKHRLSVITGGVISYNKELPFWLQANNSARLAGTNFLGGFSQLRLQKKTQRSKGIDYFYGIEGIAFAGENSRADLIQAYGGFDFRDLRFSVGKQEEHFGLNDSTLSIGNLVYGNNAKPIPKAVISTRSWVKSPILGNNFSFRAYMAHGWFEQDRHQSGAMLHQKYLYVKSSLFKHKLELTAGFHHNAQWGGRNLTNETSQPTGLANFARIFLGAAGGEDALQTDQLNALGNHLGTYDFRASYKFKNFTLSNYSQFIWEDGSGQSISNWRDGLIGMSIKVHNKNALVSGINLEVIRTDDQDAIKYNEDGNLFIEPNGYFNNSVYSSGWTYQNRVVGNPVFLIPNPESTGIHRVKNMINAINLGIEGYVQRVRYTFNYRAYENAGNYTERFDPALKLQAILASVSLPALGGEVGMRGSLEWGNYPGDNFGIIVTYSHEIMSF